MKKWYTEEKRWKRRLGGWGGRNRKKYI